jgi:putative PIN family toxin of toxin-antitoxin system
VKAIIDTNVLLSGFFFGGFPGRVLEAWRDGRFTLVLSASILAEYRAAAAAFEKAYGGADFEAFAALIVVNCEIVEAPESLPEPVCRDPDDDKFLSCALSSGASVIVSGDRALRAVSGWNGIEILTPRAFVELHAPDSA